MMQRMLKMLGIGSQKKHGRAFFGENGTHFACLVVHTVICTIIGISSVSLLPLTSVADLSPAYFVGLLQCLAMGIMFQSAPLFIGVLIYFLIGTAYSFKHPLLRWKTKPHMAAFSMAGLMGLTIQPAVFFHIQNVLGKPMVFSRSVGFATIFFSVFAAVLGAVKDIPDVEGDKAFGNLTFSVRYGKEKVFSLCLSILMIAYGSAVVLGATSSLLICKLVSVIFFLMIFSPYFYLRFHLPEIFWLGLPSLQLEFG